MVSQITCIHHLLCCLLNTGQESHMCDFNLNGYHVCSYQVWPNLAVSAAEHLCGSPCLLCQPQSIHFQLGKYA